MSLCELGTDQFTAVPVNSRGLSLGNSPLELVFEEEKTNCLSTSLLVSFILDVLTMMIVTPVTPFRRKCMAASGEVADLDSHLKSHRCDPASLSDI